MKKIYLTVGIMLLSIMLVSAAVTFSNYEYSRPTKSIPQVVEKQTDEVCYTFEGNETCINKHEPNGWEENELPGPDGATDYTINGNDMYCYGSGSNSMCDVEAKVKPFECDKKGNVWDSKDLKCNIPEVEGKL